VDCWARQQTLKGDGLLEQVQTQGRQILSRPVEWVATAGGKELPWDTGKLQYTEVRDDRIEATGRLACEKLIIRSKVHVEYDGMFKYEVELVPQGDGAVDRLDLIVPIRAEDATLLHATSDGCRTNYAGIVPEGEGRVWDSSKVQRWVLTGIFLPYI
jgi:hypothetical protein